MSHKGPGRLQIADSWCEPEVLLLLSGGIDSTACLSFYQELRRPLCCLFVNYGQSAAGREWRAAKAVAEHYSAPLQYCRWRGKARRGAGFISGRNGFLLTAALMERPSSVSVIGIGVHSGTDYGDCSEEFMAMVQEMFDLYEEGRVHVDAPWLRLSKPEIYSYCRLKGVPIGLTYSCEIGDGPCGTCLSCKDRELLVAGSS